MSLLTHASTASMDVSTGQFAPQITGLIAGEALDVAAPCYIKSSDGKVYMSNGTALNEAAEVVGFTPRAVVSGQPVTLFGAGTRFGYAASGLTPGAMYFVGATAGRLDTAPTVGDDVGVAMAINATDIVVIRSAPAAKAVLTAAIISGGAAGDHTVTGIATTDKLVMVLHLAGAGSDVTDIEDLTSEFSISAADTINNDGGTSSASGKLLVLYLDRS